MRDGRAAPGTPSLEAADPLVVAALFAADPLGTGVHLKASPGTARDRFLQRVGPFRRCPVGVSDERLWGGLDLAATLAAGRTVQTRGLLAEAEGGIVVFGSAERMDAATAARIGAVLDAGRIGLVLIDEGVEDEAPPASLLERMAFRVELDAVRTGEADVAIAAAAPVAVPDAMVEALCATADALGVGSARAPLLALRAARTIASMRGLAAVGEEEAALAARLVLSHRATRRPATPEAAAPEHDGDEAPEEEPDGGGEPECGGADVTGAVLAAAMASLPAGLLSGAADTAARTAGRAPGRAAGIRGRPLPARAGRPDGGARLALIDTLRAAAPWQRLRPSRPGRRLSIRASDLRVRRFEARSRTTAVFVVDASGSAAMQRLAEAKGAVELLLADCYVRRDQVAVIAFRGRGAELLLAPTGALARARRSLAALPGGGGTPLAAGLDAAAELARGLLGRGEAPLVVVLTDGRANVARDGSADRARAMADATACAASLRAMRVPSIVIDISPRPQGSAQALAAAMGARFVALPQADAAALSRLVRAA